MIQDECLDRIDPLASSLPDCPFLPVKVDSMWRLGELSRLVGVVWAQFGGETTKQTNTPYRYDSML